jgi:thiol-disulfide isomerase/thioredoxin
MRRFAVAALMLLAAACGEDGGGDVSAGAPPPAPAEADAESGQGRAVEAGRALIGKTAPAALLKTIDGETIDLGASNGRKPVYLKFWATWCVPCRQQMPGFEADYRKYRDRILTVAVNTGFNDDEGAIREYRQRHGISMPIALDDGSLGAALNLRVTPQHVVIGRSGRILFVGHEANAELHEALEQALAEPPAAGSAAKSIAGRTYRVGDLVENLDPALTAAAGFPATGPSKSGRPRLLMFFSPWCESYLKDSRPEQAKTCGRVREELNRLASSGGYDLVGISSGLWSSRKDLDDYRATKALRIPLHLDSDGQLFRSFGVQDVPTLIVIDAEGRVARRVGPNDKGLNVAAGAARAG